MIAAATAGPPSTPVQALRHAECVETPAGDVACGFHCATGASGDVKCADHPDGMCKAAPAGHVVCASLAHVVRARLDAKSRASCKQGALGQVACGWACTEGDEGSVRCAASPDGACAKTSTGSVRCFSNASLLLEVPAELAKTKCETSETGDVVCGYACLTGATGTIRCANTPDGACGLDAMGEAVCSALDPTKRIVKNRRAKAEGESSQDPTP